MYICMYIGNGFNPKEPTLVFHTARAPSGTLPHAAALNPVYIYIFYIYIHSYGIPKWVPSFLTLSLLPLAQGIPEGGFSPCLGRGGLCCCVWWPPPATAPPASTACGSICRRSKRSAWRNSGPCAARCI